MSEGGNLQIINASQFTLRLKNVYSREMKEWDNSFPKEIKPGDTQKFHIKFNKTNKDSGMAQYEIVGEKVGSTRDFEIQAGCRYGRIWYLQIDWKNTFQESRIFPQPTPTRIADLCWKRDGTSILTFKYKPSGVEVKDSSTPNFVIRTMYPDAEKQSGKRLITYSEAVEKVQEVDNGDRQELVLSKDQSLEEVNNGKDPYLKMWMEKYSDTIGSLFLNELTLVCTHNSGTYYMEHSGSFPWASCQRLNISEQLSQGVRVLDLRIGIQSKKSGDKKFILTHATWKTMITLKNALEQVKSFLKTNDKEVIIVDFHEFIKFDGNFDENELHKVVIDTLGDLLYPYQDKIPTLKEIWDTSHRVIVAWHRDPRHSNFFPGVDQKWFDARNLDDLRWSISEEMEKNHKNDGIWSICAILTQSAFDPVHSLSPDVENWFQAGSEWAKKSNVIAVDYVDETQIVNHAIAECLLKGQ